MIPFRGVLGLQACSVLLAPSHTLQEMEPSTVVARFRGRGTTDRARAAFPRTPNFTWAGYHGSLLIHKHCNTMHHNARVHNSG